MSSQPPPGPPDPPDGPPPLGAQPPPVGAPQPSEDDRRRKAAVPWWQTPVGIGVIGGIVAAAIAAVIVVVLLKGNNTPPPAASSGGEVFLTAASANGLDPFTASVMLPTPPSSATPAPTVTPAPTATGGATVVNAASGGAPGLYGGTRQVRNCDKQKLIDFLITNPDKGRAWAEVEGINPQDIPAYINGLTAVILRSDTRVTNHGFLNGQATTYQDVLEAGTGVLVDEFGVPRARCYCGNPLTLPVPTRVTPTYVGTPWPGFSPTTVVVVQPAPQPITVITVIDIVTGQPFGRPVGGDGPTDTQAPGLATPTPAPTASPCVGAPPSNDDRTCDLTAMGTATASSTFSSQFPVSSALDGNRATSWFSAGKAADGEDSTFTWTASHPVKIGSVSILNNSQNEFANARTGFSFTSVTVQLKDAGGAVVASMDASLNDQDITVTFAGGVTASTINLVLHHHMDPTCGGFSELIVRGLSA